MRNLGDVPGIDGLASNSEVLPPSYTYTEVNPLGEVTADSSVVGDALMSGGSDDPFAYNVGFLDQPQGGGDPQGHTAINDPMQSSYLPTYDSGTTPAVTTTGTSYDSEQLANAQTIADVGKKVGASDRDIQVALMAAMVESNLTNLDHGDRDSVGLFQQRDAWGSFEDRTTPAKAAEMFFLGGQGGQQGLLDIKDRDSRDMGDLAQDVQVSAYPERYAQHQTDAALLFGSLGGGDTTTGKIGHDPYGLTQVDGETVDNLTAAALAAAAKAYGKPLPITQGSHSTSVPASGSTHAGGGVVDITVSDGDWDGAVAALRKIGFAAWHRTPDQGPWPEHIHAVLIGDEKLSSTAAQQVQSYINNDNGLEGTTPDDGPRQFIDNRFVWGAPPKKQDPTWRDAITKMARTYVGTPFKWGGKDYSGIDAEALLHNLYGQVGVDLPLMAHDIAGLGKPMDLAHAKPGDLIGWHDPAEGLRFGIYLTNGQLVEAGGPGRVVQLSEIGADALNTFGIPIEQLIGKASPTSLARPAPTTPPSVYSNPGTVSVTTNPSTGNSMVEPHAAIPPPPKKHQPSGVPITAADYQNKPRGPM